MKNKLLSLLMFLMLCLSVQAQQFKLPLSADSLATANYKDVLNNFFQLALDRIIGDNKEIKFTSNPYAVMARLDTTLLLDTNYYRYRQLRNLNFSVAARLNDSYRFNGFSSGIKYALVNRRDYTVSRAYLGMLENDEKTKEFFALNAELTKWFQNISDAEEKKHLFEQYTSFRKGELDYSDLDEALQEQIRQIASTFNLRWLQHVMDANFNIKTYSSAIIESYKSSFNNKALWTVGISDTTYENQFFLSNLVINSEFLKGIDPFKRADIELGINATMQWVDDSLKTGRDLQRQVFGFESGLNFVWKTRYSFKSFFECKISAAYYHIFRGIYAGEKTNNFMLNGIVRIRIFNNIWVPIELRYDPQNSNVFGLLNVRANFTALKGIF